MRVILLTGAPRSEDLDWSEFGLITSITPNCVRLASGSELQHTSTASTTGPKWRVITPSGFDSSASRVEVPQIRRFPFLSTGTVHTQDVPNHEFLEHSYAVYDTQLPDEGDTTLMSYDASTLGQMSFLSDTTNASFLEQQPVTFPPSITDLKRLPTAAQIQHSNPQTVTVDLIVGIISIAPARNVPLRWSTAGMDIIELIVGDESRTGFSISFWLPPRSAPSDGISASDRQVLETLRSRQVVLLKNVALQIWQGRVFGQSLNRRTTKILTSVIRLDGRLDVESLPPLTRSKIGRVEAWVSNFLGPGEETPLMKSVEGNARTQLKTKLKHLQNYSELPPDTQ